MIIKKVVYLVLPILSFCIVLIFVNRSAMITISTVFRTPPAYLEYKVRGLNTALYYILHALQDDLKDGPDVDMSFFKRVS